MTKNKEFKSKIIGNDVVYVLESMTGGSTGASSGGTVVKAMGGVQRRKPGQNLIAQEADKDKIKVDQPTQRNPVAANSNAAIGGGAMGRHKNPKDAQKNFRKEKHKGSWKAMSMGEEQGVAEGHADQQRKIFKKNGEPVGEVGIDRESSPGVGQWYMKCYAYDIDNSGYDSYEEAVAELKHCLRQGVAEGSWDHRGFGNRPGSGGSSFKDRERNAGLENEISNIGIQINGRTWKIFPGAGPEGSQEWFNQRQKMKDMCARKTAETGKQWTMYITGESPTNETVAENDMMSFFKDLQKNNPKYKNLRIHSDPEHDELRKQDELDRQQRKDSDAQRSMQTNADRVEQDREILSDLKTQLASLEKQFDPNYEYSDDYTLWSKQRAIASNIQQLKSRIAKAEDGMSEDHSTATGGWGQGARSAIDVSSKLIGQGHDDAIHENPDWYSDEANSMSTAQLKSLVKHAAKLRHAVKQMQSQGDTLEPWQQAKVTKASDYLDTVFNAVDDDHDMGEDKSVLNIDNEPEMASALRKGQTVGMAESDEYISELYSKLSEKIAKNAPVKTYIDDFEKAAKTPNAKGHHQFKNKSKEKVKQMAIAASYAAKTPSKKKK
jgi:hypothetical protein